MNDADIQKYIISCVRIHNKGLSVRDLELSVESLYRKDLRTNINKLIADGAIEINNYLKLCLSYDDI